MVHKIAFLFLTRNNHNSSICWDLFFKNVDKKLYSIYCHPKTVPTQHFLKDNIVKNNIPTKWADISLVRATLVLLYNAFKDKDNCFFILLSDSCIPIINFKILYNNILKLNKSQIHYKYLYNKLNRYNLLNPNIKKKIRFSDFYCQHQWMILNKDLVSFFLKNDLTYLFNKVPVADEHYFISLLIMFSKENDILNKKITYCNWTNTQSMHPKTYSIINTELIINLQKQGFYFIRKVCKSFKPNNFLINTYINI